MAMKDYAAMSPPFPKKKKGSKMAKKAKSTETKTSVDPKIEGYTPKGAMRGGGSTTKQQASRAKRLANLKL